MSKVRLGVLISGEGSNLKAIHRNINNGRLNNAEIACVISNKNRDGYQWASKQNDFKAYLVRDESYTSKVKYEKQINHILYDSDVDVVILAGYMKLVGNTILDVYKEILNIHPSILPAFPGLNAYQQALDGGVRVTGVTVHMVDSGMDTGKIIQQESIRVYNNDTIETLSEKGLKVEHGLYWDAIHSYIKMRSAKTDVKRIYNTNTKMSNCV